MGPRFAKNSAQSTAFIMLWIGDSTAFISRFVPELLFQRKTESS